MEPLSRQSTWSTVATECFRDGRFRWGQQALSYAEMDDPPERWPDDSEPARYLRGEKVSEPNRGVAWAFAFLAALGTIAREFWRLLPLALVTGFVLAVLWVVVSLAF